MSIKRFHINRLGSIRFIIIIIVVSDSGGVAIVAIIVKVGSVGGRQRTGKLNSAGMIRIVVVVVARRVIGVERRVVDAIAACIDREARFKRFE